MQILGDGSERNLGSGKCSGRHPLSGFFNHLMLLAIESKTVDLKIPYNTIWRQLEPRTVALSSQMIVE
jgi:hypothetical protein